MNQSTIRMKQGLSVCPYCGGTLKTVGVANNRSKYQCHHCKEIIDIEEDRAEKWFAFEEYINAIHACYFFGKDRDLAKRFQSNTEIKEKLKLVKAYTRDFLQTPYLAVIHAVYLTDGFTKYSGSAERLINEVQKRTKSTSIDMQVYIDAYEDQKEGMRQKRKKRNAWIVAVALLAVLSAAIGLVLYQPSYYDKDTGVSVEIPFDMVDVFEKYTIDLMVEKQVESSPSYIDAEHALRRVTETFEVFELDLLYRDQPWAFDGTVTVTLPIPQEYEMGSVKIYRILSENEYEEIPSKVSGKDRTVSFDIDHFSLYALAEYYPQVLFDAAGGSSVEGQSVKRGEKLQKPDDPVRAGHTFLGWFYQGELWDFSVDTVTGDITLTAQWKGNPYSITYVTNGGSAVENETYIAGTSMTLPVPYRTGYEFLGWCDNSELEGEPVYELSKESSGNLTYYAKWNAIVYQAILDLQCNATINPLTFTIESDTLVLPTDIHREHYVFGGWYQNATYQGASVEHISAGSHGTRTYYAKWIPNQFTATLVYQDEQNTTQDIDFTVESIPTLDISDKGKYAKYCFLGWYEDKNCTKMFDNDLAENPRDIILYGKWIEYQIYTGIENTPEKITAETVLIDWSNEAGSSIKANRDFVISPTVKKIVFLGNASCVYEATSITYSGFSSNQAVHMVLDDFSFVGGSSSLHPHAIGISGGEEVLLTMEVNGTSSITTMMIGQTVIYVPSDVIICGTGYLTLRGTDGDFMCYGDQHGGNALQVQTLTVDGSVTVKAIGGNGDHATTGKGSSADSGVGNGTDGGHGIVATDVLIKSGTVIAYGGNGGNAYDRPANDNDGDPSNGRKGFEGGKGGDGMCLTATISVLDGQCTAVGGNGGEGGDASECNGNFFNSKTGGKGGTGGAGGNGISAKTVTLNDGQLSSTGGNGGDGGTRGGRHDNEYGDNGEQGKGGAAGLGISGAAIPSACVNSVVNGISGAEGIGLNQD